MKLTTVFALLALVFAAGCYTPQSKMGDVQVGMTQEQVIKILGEPQSRGGSADGTSTLYYSLMGQAFQPAQPYSVQFKNGKVVWYGRDGQATAGVQPMPVVVPVPAH